MKTKEEILVFITSEDIFIAVASLLRAFPRFFLFRWTFSLLHHFFIEYFIKYRVDIYCKGVRWYTSQQNTPPLPNCCNYYCCKSIPLSKWAETMKGVASGNLMDLTLIGSNSSALKFGCHQIERNSLYMEYRINEDSLVYFYLILYSLLYSILFQIPIFRCTFWLCRTTSLAVIVLCWIKECHDHRFERILSSPTIAFYYLVSYLVSFCKDAIL